MARPPREYTRLRGRGGNLAGRTRLYLGPDHLLQIESQGFFERYTRFYYADIQSCLIRRTRRGLIVNLVLLILGVAVLAVPTFISGADRAETLGIMFIISLIFWVPLLINLARGGTVQTILSTPASETKLVSLSNRRSARRALVRLRPLIAEAQGALRPEEIGGAEAVAPASALKIPLLPAGSTRWHALAFVALLIFAALTVAGIAYPGTTLTVATLSVVSLAAVATILALVKQSRSRIAPGARVAAQTAAGVLVFIGAAAYGRMIYAVIQRGGTVVTFWDMIVATSKFSSAQSPWLLVLDLAMATAALVLGVAGLLLLLRRRS